MDLSTTYLGLRLPHPLMPGASPLADSLDTVKRLEDAGAAAIVLQSLFEEQITRERDGLVYNMEVTADSSAEALSYFPKPDDFVFGPDEYLEQIRKIKAAVKVPVIASLNGTTNEGWLSYAKTIQEAGADALELNVYFIATDPKETGASVEQRTVEILRSVKEAVTIPVAVKLSPFFSSMAHLAKQLDDAGADGLVLFNRFYQPDIDVEALEVVPEPAPVGFVRTAAAPALAGHPVRPGQGVARGHRRRAHGRGCRQGGHGRRLRRAGRVAPARGRPRSACSPSSRA